MLTRSLSLVLLSIPLAAATLGADMEKTRASEFGLRGPVKQCIERTTYPASPGPVEQHYTTTTSFWPDGVVQEISRQVGDNPPYSRIYSRGEFTPEMLQRIAHDYQLDSDGRNTKTRKLPKYELKPGMAIGATPWEDSELHFTPPSEGTVTTIYDEKDRPKEGEVRDASGQLVLNIVRTFDDQGRTQRDQMISKGTNSNLLPHLEGASELERLNSEQKKTLLSLIAKAFNQGESSLKYDGYGRVIEKHVNRGGFGDEVTKRSYNEHGDVDEETVTRSDSPEFAGGFQMDDLGNVVSYKKGTVRSPEQTTVRYTYAYDARGNWTRRTTEWRSREDHEFTLGTLVERTLSYY